VALFAGTVGTSGDELPRPIETGGSYWCSNGAKVQD
jgi:hypothetical protein